MRCRQDCLASTARGACKVPCLLDEAGVPLVEAGDGLSLGLGTQLRHDRCHTGDEHLDASDASCCCLHHAMRMVFDAVDRAIEQLGLGLGLGLGGVE